MRRTLLLAVLLAAYVAVSMRGRVDGFWRRGQFDPFLPQARAVEQRVGEGRFADALPLAESLRRSYPDEPLIAYWRGRINGGLGNAQAEADAWEDYVRLSGSPEEACPALPEAYAHLHREADALAAYERCARFDADDPDRLTDLGDAYLHAGRVPEAARQYERASILDPHNPFLARRLADLRGATR